MSQDKTLTDAQIDAIPFTGYALPELRDHSEAEALRIFARAAIAAHLGADTMNQDKKARQAIADRFSFLEGLASETTWRRIVDEAFAIYGEGVANAHLERTGQSATNDARVAELESVLVSVEQWMTSVGEFLGPRWDHKLITHVRDAIASNRPATQPEAATAEAAGKAPAGGLGTLVLSRLENTYQEHRKDAATGKITARIRGFLDGYQEALSDAETALAAQPRSTT